MSARPPPVPGRDCGECVGCCLYLTIDTEELQSAPGILCSNWKTGCGCSIYETRPAVCREYLCAWRLFGHFDDSWRPDKIGVLMTVVNDRNQEGYSEEGFELLMTHPQIALAHPHFIPFLMKAVAVRVPFYLTLTAPPGLVLPRLFVNTYLESAAQVGQETDFRTVFEAAIARLTKEEPKLATFKHKTSSAAELHSTPTNQN